MGIVKIYLIAMLLMTSYTIRLRILKFILSVLSVDSKLYKKNDTHYIIYITDSTLYNI